ncbi:MAG TPA: NAD(P)/FAD-dependent oxidoreductase [Solirubrobacteraceae bacterium]|jgi:NADH dehydrogenase
MQTPTKTSGRHRVVVIGGGFGGVRAVKALEREPVEITLIDRTNHHLFQPLLYQVATGVLSAGQIAPALRGMFRKQKNVRVLLGVVDEIDVEHHTVRMIADETTTIPYDTLIVATGATHSYFGHDEWSQIAPGMKSLDDARRVRSRILGAFEIAEQKTDPTERDAWLTFAVVGAGPTGVELAGQIALLAHRVLRNDYRHIDPSTARVLLLDATAHVLGTYPESLSERAANDLRHLGVEVELSAPVTDIGLGGLTIGSAGDARRIEARTVIWAAGVTASPLAAQLGRSSGAEIDRAGRLHVGPDLTLPGHPEVFVIGDMITIPGVPGTAQPAIQEGKYAAKVIRTRLADKAPPSAFHYLDLGSMAVIGRTRAVASLFGHINVGGFPAFLIWGIVHLANLVGWGNRYEAIARWGWTILARNRRERVISIVSLVSEQTAMNELEQLRAAETRADEEDAQPS